MFIQQKQQQQLRPIQSFKLELQMNLLEDGSFTIMVESAY